MIHHRNNRALIFLTMSGALLGTFQPGRPIRRASPLDHAASSTSRAGTDNSPEGEDTNDSRA